MRESVLILIIMLVSVPIAGELKLHPFQDDFRISFGTTAFFFFLLWLRPSLLAGVLTGAVVVLFRVGLDWLYAEHFVWDISLYLHLPAFFFYATFASLFALFRVNHLHHRPLLVGLLGTVVEIAANLVELFFRSPVWENVFQFSVIGPIAVIALIRSFFVLSFFNIIKLRQAVWMEEQQRHRNERVLLLVSNLYEESIHLKKTLQQVEDITRECYELYRELKEQGQGERDQRYSRQMLMIAGQVHEVKKDNQRIYAGLSKLISDENERDNMPLAELLSIVVRAHEKYAQMLDKDISFTSTLDAPNFPCHIYTTLSLVNNLVANAVEAIEDSGHVWITVTASETEQWLQFAVADDGPGISVRDKSILFMPGFTTKYDESGRPSTGIGLSYVKEVVESLQGQIEIAEKVDGASTSFVIRLPQASLVQKG